MRLTMGLDLGRHTGWAVMRDGELFRSGVVDLAGSHGEAVATFAKWMEPYARTLSVVAWEEPAFFRGANSIFHPRVEGALLLVLERAGVPYATVHVASLKKYATGKGNATKEEMIAAAGIGKVSEHEADAYHVARWADEHVGATGEEE